MGTIIVSEKCYLKDPTQTKLGERIISASIQLIAELGFERFTFKRLAIKISSTEASVYRYFENKHKLLLYLIAWYWTWVKHRMVLLTSNITDPTERLQCIIKNLCEGVVADPNFAHINEVDLQTIVIAESIKTLHTKEVEADVKDGYFVALKELTEFVAQSMLDINPKYPFGNNLAAMLIDNIHEQKFNTLHFKSLSDLSIRKTEEDLQLFLSSVVFSTLNNHNEKNT